MHRSRAGPPVYADAASDCRDYEKPDTSIRGCDALLRMNPSNADAFANRARAYFIKNDLSRAVADFSLALAITPRDASLYYNRASAYELLDENALARADVEKF